MYEIHGGGFLGEAQTDNGANLVSTGPVIYVYVKYRLGILGFLADKALGPHSGDYGLQDQQAALRWVRQNIAAFGGNPHNVTIFGESAGGASVCDQVASPRARGLFRRGISISGFYNFNVNTIWWPADCKSKLLTEAQAQKLGAAFAAAVSGTSELPEYNTVDYAIDLEFANGKTVRVADRAVAGLFEHDELHEDGFPQRCLEFVGRRYRPLKTPAISHAFVDGKLVEEVEMPHT